MFEVFNAIANIASTNEKIQYLSSHSNNPDVQTILYLAYSPKFVYGLKKVDPNSVSVSIDESEDRKLEGDTLFEFECLLKGLHKRELTGNAALGAFNDFIATLDHDERILACNIIKRDLRCGMNVSNINKAIPGLIEQEPPYQRCSLMKGGKFDDFPETFYSQVKADGMFLNLLLSNKDEVKIEATTRAGNEFPIHLFKNVYEQLIEAVSEGNFNSWYAGELIIRENGRELSRKESNGITNSLSKGGTIDFEKYDFVYHMWDRVPVEEFVHKGKYSQPYKHRLSLLLTDSCFIDLPNFVQIETELVEGYEDAMKHYNESRRRGLEGTVIKNPDAGWMDGTSPHQIKMKAEVEIDLRVVSMNPGKGKHEKTFGSLNMTSDDGLVQCAVSGFSDEERTYIFENFEEKIKNSVATIRGNELITSKNSEICKIFLPRFVEFRFDKNTTDDLERIKEIFESVL